MSAQAQPYQRELELPFSSQRPIRTFFRLLNMPWLLQLAAYFLHFLKALPLLLSPVVLAEIIRVAETRPPNSEAYLLMILGGYVVVLFLNIPLHMWYVRVTSKAMRSMEMSLRGAMCRRLQHLSMKFHSERESGRLQSKVLRDVEEIVRLGELYFNGVVSNVINQLWALGVALATDWKIGVAFLFIAPLAVALIRMFRRIMQERNRNYRTNIEAMSQRVNEMIDLVPVTRAHGVEDFEMEAVQQRLKEVYSKGRQLDGINALFASSSFVVYHVAITLLLALCTWMVLYGHMSLEKIALYNGLFIMVVGSLGMLTSMTPQFTRAFEAIRSLGEILECPDFEENVGKEKVDRVDGNIEFRNVRYQYSGSKQPAVKDFSLHVNPGDCVAIVGESGSGKSTLMQLTIGFLRAQGGDIILDGRSMAELDMRTFRRFTAMVPQHTILFSGSIRENITYGLRQYEDAQVWQALEAAQLRSVIEALPEGLETRVGENGLKLSGGQRQRLAIARALIRNPRIIILDEATSALDVVSEREVQKAIDNLVKGRTTFIVAHRLSTIRQANKVVVMRDGEAIEVGTPEELMQQEGEFARLKALQT